MARKKPIMHPQAEEQLWQLRYEITKQSGWLDISAGDKWWEALTPIRQSEVNGLVTKMLVAKAQRDMMQAYNNRNNTTD